MEFILKIVGLSWNSFGGYLTQLYFDYINTKDYLMTMCRHRTNQGSTVAESASDLSQHFFRLYAYCKLV